jgi:hypothetical protein
MFRRKCTRGGGVDQLYARSYDLCCPQMGLVSMGSAPEFQTADPIYFPPIGTWTQRSIFREPKCNQRDQAAGKAAVTKDNTCKVQVQISWDII